MSRFSNNITVTPTDRRRVHGFAPGLRMSMRPRASNLNFQQIPQGQLLFFNPHVEGFLRNKMQKVQKVAKGRVEVVSDFDGKHEFSGEHYALAVEAKFGKSSKFDFGFRYFDFLADLPYDPVTGYDKADEYFETLHPELTCEMGLETVQLGASGDVLNNEKPWPCPTCRIAFLESTDCQDRMFKSGLDYDLLERLRLAMLDSYKAGAFHARLKYERSKTEVEAGRHSYNDADFLHMKLIHKKAPHLEQAEIQTAAAKAQGEAIGAQLASVLQAQNDKQEAERVREENERLKKEIEALKQKKAK